ncbi:MAG: AsnC family transcriptional regulator [Alphaproteobacteria bacterium]|nr:MAG: AsnC family transcriptional regulator [Alphaproteobacteria bacterium]
MKKARLDQIDRNILKRLQDDGRVTNVALAKSVGMSAPPCLRRVRALEDAGYIKGYNAQINHNTMGFGVTIFAMVTLKSQVESDLVEFEEYITKIPVVRECHMLAGEVDFILKIVAKDWDSYNEIFRKDLSDAPHVNSIKSSLSVRAAKNKPGIPIEMA